MVYLLEMYRRNDGLGRQNIKKPGAYTVLGPFDCLSLSAKDAVEEIFQYPENGLSGFELYNRSAIPMFSLPKITDTALLEDMLAANPADGHVYQLTFLKLNPQITTVFKRPGRPSKKPVSGMAFMESAAAKVIRRMSVVDGRIEFTFLGCLGSFDYLFICRLKAADAALWERMSGLSASPGGMRYGKEQYKFFNFSSTLVAYSSALACKDPAGPRGVFGETPLDLPRTPATRRAAPETHPPALVNLISELLNLYKEAKRGIPELLCHSMEQLLYSCKYFLYNGEHSLTGVKLYQAIKDFLLRVSAYNWKSDTIGEFILFLNSVIPISAQLQSVDLDSMDGLNSSVSKMVYAYEHFFTAMCERIRGFDKAGEYGRNVNVYVTIGNQHKIMSQEYLSIHPMFSPARKNLNAKLFLSFDLPCAAALDLTRTYAMLNHEAGHYSARFARETRNKHILILFHAHLCSHVRGYFFEHKWTAEPAVLAQAFKAVNDWLFDVLQAGIARNGVDLRNAHLRYFLHMLCNALHRAVVSARDESAAGSAVWRAEFGYEKAEFADLLLDALAEFIRRPPVKQLNYLVSETHADLFMLSVMDYTWKEVSDKFYDVFSGHDARAMGEHVFLLRMAIIYFYCCHRERRIWRAFPLNKMNACINKSLSAINGRKLPDGQKIFLRKVYGTAKKEYLTYKPLVMYLLETFKPGWRGELFKNNRDSQFPDKAVERAGPEKQINFFLTHWYAEMTGRQRELERYIR